MKSLELWRNTTVLAFFIALGTSILDASYGATGQATDSPCKALERSELAHIPDAVTQVVSAPLSDRSDSPGLCEVTGYVAPSVSFTALLPAKWNGKFIELGCGGACGSMEHVRSCDTPVSRGNACIVSDGGHRSTPQDFKWGGADMESAIEYYVRASHVVTIAGKVVTELYYGHVPKHSYFMGCSAGGHQAMTEVSRFPCDFDGIIAGDVSPSYATQAMQLLWANRALVRPGGRPLLSTADLEVLHNAVVSRCDLRDAVRDGLIGDPRSCHFDSTELRCTRDFESGCLTDERKRVAQTHG